MKLCTECACSRMVGGYPICADKRNMTQSMADGRERPIQSCDYLRESEKHCSPAALWFVPRSKPMEAK